MRTIKGPLLDKGADASWLYWCIKWEEKLISIIALSKLGDGQDVVVFVPRGGLDGHSCYLWANPVGIPAAEHLKSITQEFSFQIELGYWKPELFKLLDNHNQQRIKTWLLVAQRLGLDNRISKKIALFIEVSKSEQ